jgi:hypothetical protein
MQKSRRHRFDRLSHHSYPGRHVMVWVIPVPSGQNWVTQKS